MKQPLVSIVMPTYNGKKEWISAAIDSVLDQTYRNFELIIINDASTNTVEETILSYQHKDSRILYIKNPTNVERSVSKNK
jgi:glycosyltransferase involved in cell wall biosynthesis